VGTHAGLPCVLGLYFGQGMPAGWIFPTEDLGNEKVSVHRGDEKVCEDRGNEKLRYSSEGIQAVVKATLGVWPKSRFRERQRPATKLWTSPSRLSCIMPFQFLHLIQMSINRKDIAAVRYGDGRYTEIG
jgi:hypothetical protein